MDKLQRPQVVIEIPPRRSTDIDADYIHRSKLRHQWLSQHLEVLCLLYRFYENSPQDYAKLFNKLFYEDLLAEGFNAGLNHERLVSRWNSLKDWDGGHDLWEMVNIGLTQREARYRYRHLLDDIEEAALELGIPLTLRVQTHRGALNHSRHLGQRAQRVQEIRGVLGERVSTTEGTDSENEPPAKLRRVRSAGDSPRTIGLRKTDDHFPEIRSAPVGDGTPNRARHLSTARASVDQFTRLQQLNGEPSKKPPKVLPRLLFRFSDDNSSSRGPFFNNCTGFTAGRFVNDAVDIPSPPTGAALRAVALSHLTPELMPTPFISFFSNMLPALHRAIRSSSNSYLTIVDGHIAEQVLKDRFGERTKVAYSVQDIVREFGLQLRGGYYGPSEFLLYGAVSSSAIVGVLKIRDLLQSEFFASDFSSVLQLDLIKQAPYAAGLNKELAKEAEHLNYRTGIAVQRFLKLTRVKPEYQELLARQISRWWRFQRASAGINTSRSDYLRGIFTTMGGRRGKSVRLEEEDKDEEDFLQKLHDEAGMSDRSLDLEITENPGLRLDIVSAHTRAEPFDEDEDLIDRQLEADCPELCANHYQATHDEDLEEESAQSDDYWEADVREASPCTTRKSSLDVLANELCKVAEDCSFAPRMAHINDWEGSPWRSVTPYRPASTLRTATTADEQNGFFLDLTEDTEEEDSEESTKKAGPSTKKSTVAGGMLKDNASINVIGCFNPTKKSLRKKQKDGHVNAEEGANGITIVDSVGLSGN